jgi:hypothetical protein
MTRQVLWTRCGVTAQDQRDRACEHQQTKRKRDERAAETR